MLFLQSVAVALFGAATMVSATNGVSHEMPNCMKSCLGDAHTGTACSAMDVMCLCTETTSLLEKIGKCAAASCKDDKDFGAGYRTVVNTCASAEAHRTILKRNAPGLFTKREINYDACQVCEDSKTHPPTPVLLTPTYPVSNLTYSNSTRPPVKSSIPKQLPKSPTGAASTVKAASTLSVLGALAVLLVMA